MRAGSRTRGFVAVAFAVVSAVASVAAAGPGAGAPSTVTGKNSASSSVSASSAVGNTVEFTLLHGTKTLPSSIPSQFASALASPPWTVYSHYVVLSTKSLPLTVGATVKESLPTGHTVEITLVTPGTAPKMDMVLKDAKGVQVAKGTYTQPKGTPVLPWQVPYKAGGLVVAVRP